MFETTPWFIGLEGVEHSAATARMLAWAATNGNSGIIEPPDLYVRARSVPGPGVVIDPGGFVVKSTYPNAKKQSYVERAPSSTELDIPATGSSGGATRYIIARILDPWFPGGGSIPAPGTENSRVYADAAVVSSLSQPYPFVKLARINQPANTAAITQSMITDLREVANPLETTAVYARPNVASDTGWYLGDKTSGGEYFPNGGNPAKIYVPEWATRMSITGTWISVKYDGSRSSWGDRWIEYGTEYRDNGWTGQISGQDFEFATQLFGWDQNEGVTYRDDWIVADTVPVPTKLRGKEVNFVFKARVSSSANAAKNAVYCDAVSGLKLEVKFAQVAETADLLDG